MKLVRMQRLTSRRPERTRSCSRKDRGHHWPTSPEVPRRSAHTRVRSILFIQRWVFMWHCSDSNASSSVKKRNVSERASKSRSSILNRPQGGAPHEGKCSFNLHTPFIQGQPVEPLPVPQDAEAATGSCPINQSCEPKDSTEADEAKCDARVENGPDEYMVIDALREFTGLVNNVPVMWERIREAQHILDQTASLVDQMMPDLRETCLVREKLEVLLLSKMKKKPELWDGTAQLNKKDRKFRMEWLRSERKDETVKKWREDNEAFERNGRSPEPYENYA